MLILLATLACSPSADIVCPDVPHEVSIDLTEALGATPADEVVACDDYVWGDELVEVCSAADTWTAPRTGHVWAACLTDDYDAARLEVWFR